jgi:hypothetical protein
MEHVVLEVKSRLYSEPLQLSAPRVGAAGERIVSPPPVHHVLAARIGCRREQVTRDFSALADEGLVTKMRGALTCTGRHALVVDDLPVVGSICRRGSRSPLILGLKFMFLS